MCSKIGEQVLGNVGMCADEAGRLRNTLTILITRLQLIRN